jgi:hypothetical protein
MRGHNPRMRRSPLKPSGQNATDGTLKKPEFLSVSVSLNRACHLFRWRRGPSLLDKIRLPSRVIKVTGAHSTIKTVPTPVRGQAPASPHATLLASQAAESRSSIRGRRHEWV